MGVCHRSSKCNMRSTEVWLQLKAKDINTLYSDAAVDRQAM